MRLYDTHCHLDATFDAPVDVLLAEAKAGGVGRILLPGVAPSEWPTAAGVAAADPDVRLALGIHPQAVRDLTDDAVDEALAALPALLRAHRAVALGEIGLDRRWDRDPVQRARQERIFRAQLDLAADLGLPPLLHCLDAHGPTLEIWRAHPCRRHVPGVLHSYSGSAELVPRYVELGLFVSISGAVTFPGARKVPEAVRAVPGDRLLIETDAPYQPPHPLDERPNRPARLIEVARAVATLRGEPVERIAEVTWANAERLFG